VVPPWISWACIGIPPWGALSSRAICVSRRIGRPLAYAIGEIT
jgi:hypothetical protein